MTDITESAGYVTKDSGYREEYPTGMRRDTQDGKPRYDLVDKAFLKRQAELMLRGAEKYGEDNWRLAETVEEWSRFRASGNRHQEQHMEGDRTEDHAAAVAFNLAAEAYVEARLKAKGYTLTWPWPGVPQWMDPKPELPMEFKLEVTPDAESWHHLGEIIGRQQQGEEQAVIIQTPERTDFFPHAKVQIVEDDEDWGDPWED